MRGSAAAAGTRRRHRGCDCRGRWQPTRQVRDGSCRLRWMHEVWSTAWVGHCWGGTQPAAAAAAASRLGVCSQISTKTPSAYCMCTHAGAASPASQRTELPKNFDPAASEQRLYDWCAAVWHKKQGTEVLSGCAPLLIIALPRPASAPHNIHTTHTHVYTHKNANARGERRPAAGGSRAATLRQRPRRWRAKSRTLCRCHRPTLQAGCTWGTRCTPRCRT